MSEDKVSWLSVLICSGLWHFIFWDTSVKKKSSLKLEVRIKKKTKKFCCRHEWPIFVLYVGPETLKLQGEKKKKKKRKFMPVCLKSCHWAAYIMQTKVSVMMFPNYLHLDHWVLNYITKLFPFGSWFWPEHYIFQNLWAKGICVIKMSQELCYWRCKS